MNFYYEVTSLNDNDSLFVECPIHFDDPQKLCEIIEIGKQWKVEEVTKQYYDENTEEE